MRLLQIANVPTRLGGTGACTYDVKQSLPQVEHRIAFTRAVNEKTNDHFQCMTGGPEVIDQWRTWAEVVLCHNISPSLVRNGDIYYSHSRTDLRFAVDVKLKGLWCVSHWLARKCNARVDVVYQPVSQPPSGERGNSILRICTASSRKWIPADLQGYYSAISSSLPDAQFVFVGCPGHMKSQLIEQCFPNPTTFRVASLSARQFYSMSRVLLYLSSQTETYGRTICEAQQVGCIPIVSDHSGMAEQILHGVDGFRVKSLAQVREFVVRSFAQFSELSSNARRNAQLRGSLSIWAERFFNSI